MKSLSSFEVMMAAAMILLLLFPALGQDELKFGSKVMPHDVDESRALSPFYVGPEFAFVDLDNNGIFDPGDPVYINVNPADSVVSQNDVRLTPFGIFAAGSQVRPTDPDHDKALIRFGASRYPVAELRYFDVDGGKVYSLEDPVYLDINPGTVGAGDIRMTSYKDYPAGSRVRDSDVDSDKPTMTLPGMLCFYNANGNVNNGGWGFYDEGDVVYMDTQYPFYQVTVNDIRMSEGLLA